MSKPKTKPKKKRGPKLEVLKIRDLDWEEAVKRSCQKRSRLTVGQNPRSMVATAS
jgi:hypothetical protein